MKEKKLTFSNQENLPPLPVPDLVDSCMKYLESIQPLVNEEEYKTTKALVDDFIKPDGQGHHLQEILLKRAQENRNWLEEWWEYAAYLSWREPIATYVNMFTGFGSFTEFEQPVPQTRRGAEIIRYAVEYSQLLQQEKIPPEQLGGRNLCMNLFTRLFSSCRIPGEPADEFKRYDFSTVRHVIVMHKKCYFVLDVYDGNNQLLTIGDLEIQLNRILKHAEYIVTSKKSSIQEDGVVDAGVGALTSTTRTAWSTAREELSSIDLSNKRNLRKVESALFAISLDEAAPRDPSELLHHVACGACMDRWFDKSLQYIVFSNGMVGANMEHGNADATAFMSMFRWLGQRYLLRAGGIDTLIESQTGTYLPPPEALHWTLTPSLLQSIEKAVEGFRINSSQLVPFVKRFKTFGKKWIKSQKFAPDSFVQMGIQLTYFTLNGHVCSTYESAHTRLFYHGRTETIRPLTNESTTWVKAMNDNSISKEEKYKLMKSALEKHGEIGMNALNGNGFDRHFLGLQIASMLEGSPLPAIYEDPSYKKSGGGGNFVLSTSNVSGYRWLWGGFAPMVQDGIGICYDLDDDFLGFLVTTFVSGKNQGSRVFMENLFQSFERMRELCIDINSSRL